MWLDVTVLCSAIGVLFGLRYFAGRRRSACSFGRSDRCKWPDELVKAKLVYSEKLFRAFKPFPMVARIDRAYLKPNGMFLLVEFKSRTINRAFFSDVIQLSVQRTAMSGQAGPAVASHGYVLVKSPTGGKISAHRVSLLTEQQVTDLYERRGAIVAGETSPSYPSSPAICHGCKFRGLCRGHG